MVRCRSCTKKWKVSWAEEYITDSKVFVLQCTTCDYLIRIKNLTEALKYRTLHEDQSGHTGMLLSEEGKYDCK